MAEKTAAQKRAQKNYMSKFAVARVRITTDLYEDVKRCADSSGDSVNEFLTKAIEKYVMECHA